MHCSITDARWEQSLFWEQVLRTCRKCNWISGDEEAPCLSFPTLAWAIHGFLCASFMGDLLKLGSLACELQKRQNGVI